MKVYVMSSERKTGVGKKTNNPYDSVVVQVVYKVGEKYFVKELWINPQMLHGYIPEYGDVLEIQVDFNGFVQAVIYVENEKFELTVVSNK